MSKQRRSILPILAAMVFAIALCPGVVYADEASGGVLVASGGLATQDDNIATGTWGTCPWEISADGVLTVHPGESPEVWKAGPWGAPSFAPYVKAVVFAEEDGKRVVVHNCNNLLLGLSGAASVDLSGLDTSGANSMAGMLSGCSSLRSVDLSVLDASSVVDASKMFYGCSSLERVDLSVLGESDLMSMWGMFDGCSSLESVEFAGITTAGASNMNYLFSGCAALELLDLSAFDTSNVTMMIEMFSGCSSLTTVRVGDAWSTEAVGNSTGMFDGCTSLVGGNGTAYDENHLDAEYARIDAEGAPGYLTKAPVKKSLADSVVELSQTSYAYDGKAKEPAVTVRLGDTVLKGGEDYAVAYKDNVEAGTATVTVTGKGAYTGSKAATFSIVAAEPDDGPSGEASDPGESGGSDESGGAPEPGKDEGGKSGEAADSGESGGSAEPGKPGDPGESGASGPAAGPKTELKAYEGEAEKAGFTDLDEGAWYLNDGGKFPGTDTLYLDYTIKRGLMSGYTGDRAGQFGPDDALTRGMAATIIYRMATGKTAETTDNDVDTPFSDVPRGAWYAAAVKWCAENKVVTGYAGTTLFGPEDPITREQLATVIGRYMDPEAAAGADVSQFGDAASISGYAKAGIAYCNANGIMTGIGDTGNFQPGGKATRCQMSKVIAVTARMAE